MTRLSELKCASVGRLPVFAQGSGVDLRLGRGRLDFWTQNLNSWTGWGTPYHGEYKQNDTEVSAQFKLM